MIVTTMLAAAPEILDPPAEQSLLKAGMTENFVQRLQVVGGCCVLKRQESWPNCRRRRPDGGAFVNFVNIGIFGKLRGGEQNW